MKHCILLMLAMLIMMPIQAQLMTSFTAEPKFHDPEVKYSKKSTSFQLMTDNDAQEVMLNIYDTATGGTPVKSESMAKYCTSPIINDKSMLWCTIIYEDLKGKFYTFNVKKDGRWLGETQGVRAMAVGINGQRGAIIDMKDTNPKRWNKDRSPVIAHKDLVIYEMHHRDYSIDPSGGFTYPGKYLALTERNGIDHLKKLGVNAVHILPSYDYASVDETRLNEPQYNWGYDPVNYWVPEGSYSTDPNDPVARIHEFKRMVQALHKAGIKVILDVVFNHTFDIDNSAFQRTRPGYYYRKNADGTYSNGSGCGNETASEQIRMCDYIIDCCKYWVKEYHIDGFRFDLMGIHDIKTMNRLRKELPDVLIYGEGWSAGNCALPQSMLAMKANISQMPGIAAFSDEMRDGLRGPWDGDDKAAFLGGVKGNEESVKFGIAGAIQHPQVDMTRVNYSKAAWATQPTQMIAYVSCHDDMCLVDRLRASVKGITQDELIRLDLLAQTAVMTSQGIPFMLSGEEMLRDKKGVHNSYNSPDSVNHLDWDNLKRYPQVMEYYRDLIALRKAHPAFRLGDADLVRRHLEFLPTQDCVVAYRLKDHAGGDMWQDIYVVLNTNRQSRTITVPDGNYTIVCRDGQIRHIGLDTFSGNTVNVPAQSALIFHN